MRITRLATIVGCLLSTALLSVNAQEAMDAPEPVVQKIAPMFSAKAQTISYFTAPNDMIALGVVTRDFKKQVYYTNANGDFVISGMFYDTQTKQNFNAAVNDKLVITLPEALTQGISELPSISHGSGEQVVGVVEYSDFPPAAKELPVIGAHNRFDVEQILSLKPDLIVGWLSGNSQDDLQGLKQLGLPVFISEPGTVDDIVSLMERLGELTGHKGQSLSQASAFRVSIDASSENYSTRRPVSVFYQN